MKFVDDRTQEQKKTHNRIVLMTDSFLSGWGEAENGVSYAGWAFQDGQQCQVERWVRSRSDAKRVRIVSGDYRPSSKTAGHCHIYVVDENHPSLR